MSHVPSNTTVAYFSMEIALDKAIPTYSGGLGVLAGDTLRSPADLAVPVVGITLLHRKGYFEQHLDEHGNQTEAPVVVASRRPAGVRWRPGRPCTIEGRTVHVRAWKYPVRGVTGHEVPVYLLDTQLPENSEWDRTLTDYLYGGDNHYRLCQEIVLGMGGAALLRALNCPAQLYHLNEGHSALLTLCLLEWQLDGRKSFELDDARYRGRAPTLRVHDAHAGAGGPRQVPARRRAAGARRASRSRCSRRRTVVDDETLNMTHVALRLARWVNGVAMKHREVSQGMFPNFPIDAITNGVHAGTWTSPAFQALLDKRIPEWRTDNLYLRYAVGIPLQEIRAAHAEAKKAMIAAIAERTRCRARSEGVHDRLCAARHAVQARRSPVHRSDAARARWRRASARSRSCSAARRIRTTAAARISFAASTRRRRRSRARSRWSTSRTTRWRSRRRSSPAWTSGSTTR